MRRFILVVPFLVACSGGLPSLDSSSAQSQFVAAMGDAGVKCLHREPPPFHACDGLDAGAVCTVPDDDDADAGPRLCKALRDGRLVCAEADDDGDDRDGRADGGHDDDGDRDGGEHHGGDAGMRDLDHGWMHDGGLPAPVQAAVDACVGHAADDVCSVTFHEHAMQGACRLAPDGKTLVCAPLCPRR